MNEVNHGGMSFARFNELLRLFYQEFFFKPYSMAKKDVNNNFGTLNCCLVTVAALKGLTVTDLLAKQESLSSYINGAAGIEEVLKVHKAAGFTDARLVFKGEKNRLNTFLNFDFPLGATKKFTLAYTTHDTTSGHVVNATVTKTDDGIVELFIIDFQQPAHSAERFKTEIPKDAVFTYLIEPGLDYSILTIMLVFMVLLYLIGYCLLIYTIAPAMSILISQFEGLKI